MTLSKHKTPCILITIDVEDWFQVENFKPYIPFSTWDTRELRVEKNVHKLLDLFDSIKLDGLSNPNPTDTQNTGNDNLKLKIQNSKLPRRVKATFFILGWIAERLPHLVKEVRLRGHEVASHGYNHDLCAAINHNDLKHDLTKSKKLLEDITGSEIYGYRAPSFSINNDILKVIEDCGYQYDSSYNSFGLHGRYGKVNFNGYPKNGIAIKLSDNFYELPISNLKFKTKNSKFKIELPWGGGGYFRLIPWLIFKYGMKIMVTHDKTILFYLHPWELDPSQPRVYQAKFSYRFRHYTNLAKTSKKLSDLITCLIGSHFMSCADYLEEGIRPDSR